MRKQTIMVAIRCCKKNAHYFVGFSFSFEELRRPHIQFHIYLHLFSKYRPAASCQQLGLRAGSHFDISINISININIRKICVNRGYISISISISTRNGTFSIFLCLCLCLCCEYLGVNRAYISISKCEPALNVSAAGWYGWLIHNNG